MRRTVLIASAMALGSVLIGSLPASGASLWSECGKLSYGRTYCSTITSNTPNTKVIAYRDSFENLTRSSSTGTCSADRSRTIKWGVGSTLSTEIKTGIFGGIKGEINASVEKATTTGYVTSTSFTVPAHSTVHCDRGVVKEVVGGYTRIMDGGVSTIHHWSAYAPTAARWWIYS